MRAFDARSCPTYGAIRVVCLILEAVLFGLFTMCMMCDQYSVITTGTTQIDRLKGEAADSLGLREVFGGADCKFSLNWLLPVNIWFPTYDPFSGFITTASRPRLTSLPNIFFM